MLPWTVVSFVQAKWEYEHLQVLSELIRESHLIETYINEALDKLRKNAGIRSQQMVMTEETKERLG